MYVPIHTYTHMRSVYRHTTRDVRGTATKSNGHGHTMGALAQMVPHTYTYIKTHAQRKKTIGGAEKKMTKISRAAKRL